ncbi:MAG: indole-3-glycerol phosphate synthase TrpC [Acidobacteriota bacterium]|nr:indole-3-glycerol phosphate synthase TrpC [Acidobacteriota bacterium]
MDILTQIVDRTKEIVAERSAGIPLEKMKAFAAESTHRTNSLAARLVSEQPHVIAEFKRRSPSRPNINMDADPVDVARKYKKGGASAMSVLTEPDFFAGSPEDLKRVRAAVDMPLLRKDFLVDPYQFYEARAMGADLVLLIARILEPAQLAEYTHLAHDLGMEVLCEIHDMEEMETVGDAPVDFIGVNCRDLKQFSTNLDLLVDLTKELPKGIPWVAESGMHSTEDVLRLYEAGYRLFLIGEYLMKNEDPVSRLKDITAL